MAHCILKLHGFDFVTILPIQEESYTCKSGNTGFTIITEKTKQKSNTNKNGHDKIGKRHSILLHS